MKKRKRKLTEEERNDVLLNELQLNNSTAVILRTVETEKVSTDTIKRLIHICLLKALPNTAGALAKKIGHLFTATEIDLVSEACKEHGYNYRLTDVYQQPTVESEAVLV